jgi:hypothetical protein
MASVTVAGVRIFENGNLVATRGSLVASKMSHILWRIPKFEYVGGAEYCKIFGKWPSQFFRCNAIVATIRFYYETKSNNIRPSENLVSSYSWHYSAVHK